MSPTHVLDVLKPKELLPSKSHEDLIADALKRPIDAPRLEEIIQKREKTVIVVPDKTRNCGADKILPILIDKLNRLGAADTDLKIVIASGSHAAHPADEILQIVGTDMVDRIDIIEHDCHNPKELVHLGGTKFGTPVYLSRHLVEAERVIVMAAAVHHYFAGYGGGLKMLNPGCAGYETIRRNHALTIDSHSGTIHCNCRAGVVSGNPVQEDLLDSMRFTKVDFLIETILNDESEIVEVLSGDLFAAHKKACSLVDDFYRIPIKEKADLVVVSCGGLPKDINFIQAHKSLQNAFFAVREGGVILLVARCTDGLGSPTFFAWFDYEDEERFLRELKENYALNGTTALSLKMKTKQVNVVLVSELADEVVAHLGMLSAPTLTDGWRLAQSLLPANFKCYIMPNGSLTLPSLN